LSHFYIFPNYFKKKLSKISKNGKISSNSIKINNKNSFLKKKIFDKKNDFLAHSEIFNLA
jgi:hypothetical protein